VRGSDFSASLTKLQLIVSHSLLPHITLDHLSAKSIHFYRLFPSICESVDSSCWWLASTVTRFIYLSMMLSEVTCLWSCDHRVQLAFDYDHMPIEGVTIVTWLWCVASGLSVSVLRPENGCAYTFLQLCNNCENLDMIVNYAQFANKDLTIPNCSLRRHLVGVNIRLAYQESSLIRSRCLSPYS